MSDNVRPVSDRETGLEVNNVRRFLAEAQRQGFRPKALRSGSMWLAPDGTSKITVHRTPSDARAFDNMVAEFRRAGMRWPVTDDDKDTVEGHGPTPQGGKRKKGSQ